MNILYIDVQLQYILISFIILLNDYFRIYCILVWKVDDLTRLLRIMRSLELAKNPLWFIFSPTTRAEELTMEQIQMAYIYSIKQH